MNRVSVAVLVLALPAGLAGCSKPQQPQVQEQSVAPTPATAPEAATVPPPSSQAPQATPAPTPAVSPTPAKPRGTPLPI